MNKVANFYQQFNKFFKITIRGIIPLLSIVSCGNGNKKLITNEFSVDAQMVSKENLTDQERNIATRICYAYQSKDARFATSDYLGLRFNFDINTKTCADEVIKYQIVSTLKRSYNGYYYTSNTTKEYYSQVQTNNFGYLAQLCSKINNGELISNTIEMAGQVIQVRFQRDSLDTYTINYFSKTSDLTYKIDSSETFKVRTQFDLVTGKILGMDEEYSAQKVCGDNPKKFSNISQKFTGNN